MNLVELRESLKEEYGKALGFSEYFKTLNKKIKDPTEEVLDEVCYAVGELNILNYDMTLIQVTIGDVDLSLPSQKMQVEKIEKEITVYLRSMNLFINSGIELIRSVRWRLNKASKKGYDY